MTGFVTQVSAATDGEEPCDNHATGVCEDDVTDYVPEESSTDDEEVDPYADENWKLRIKNTTSAKIKVTWWCDKQKLQTTTFPGSKGKTREVDRSKCTKDKLSVSLRIDNTKFDMYQCARGKTCPSVSDSSKRELWDDLHKHDYKLAGHKKNRPAISCLKIFWEMGYMSYNWTDC